MRAKENLKPLAVMSSEVARITGLPPHSYRSIWEGIVNGQIRAVQIKNRWFADPREVAEDLGLTVKQLVA